MDAVEGEAIDGVFDGIIGWFTIGVDDVDDPADGIIDGPIDGPIDGLLDESIDGSLGTGKGMGPISWLGCGGFRSKKYSPTPISARITMTAITIPTIFMVCIILYHQTIIPRDDYSQVGTLRLRT